MERPPVEQITVMQYRNGAYRTESDDVAVEAPLQIYVEHGPIGMRATRKLSITMRTPGHDEDLCAGFVFTEGILRDAGQLSRVEPWGDDGVRAVLSPDLELSMDQLERNFFTNSSCGVCGKTDVQALEALPLPVQTAAATVPSPGLLLGLPGALLQAQAQFERTGGIHASGLFGTEGQLLCLREDVGRHNALDKLIGHYIRTQGRLPEDCLLLLSGRASFELLQKAAIARIPVVCAVGAPSSLAISTAKAAGICLVGFLREGRFNVYAGGKGPQTT